MQPPSPPPPLCTDPTATNYVADASSSIGIACAPDFVCCEYPVAGCTDPSRPNYLPTAIVEHAHDCAPKTVYGCMISSALNYDPDANRMRDAHACVFPRIGCGDKNAHNYESSVNVPIKGTCTYDRIGCMLRDAVDFDSEATICGTCAMRIRGCADATAKNFVLDATSGDKSLCLYRIDGCRFPGASECHDARPDRSPARSLFQPLARARKPSLFPRLGRQRYPRVRPFPIDSHGFR